MKTLNQMLDGYKPKAGDEQKFKDKHVVVKSKLSKPTENEGQFAAPEVKVYKRGPTHGYDQGKDEEVYEAAEQTPPFEPSKSTFKKAKNPNRTPMDSVKALAQKGMKTKTNEEIESIEEMDKSQDPPGRDGGHQFPPGPKVSKKVIKAINKDPAKHLSDLFAKEYSKKKMKEEAEQVEEVRKMASGGRDNAGGQYYDIDNGDGTIGFGYKPGKSQPSSSHSNYEMKPEPKHPLHGKIVTAKHSDGKEVTGRLMGTEHQGTVAKIKHSSGMIHSTDAKTVKKAISEMKEEVEQIDEKLTASDPTSKWIHDFVHSKNKKFAGKSREERIKMALGAKYAKEDFDFTDEELVLLEASDGAKNLYVQNHKESMDMLKKIGEGIKQHKANVMMNNNIHYGHVGTMKNIKRQLEDLHQQVTQESEYARPMRIGEEVEEEQQAPLFERTSSLNKLIEAAYKKQPVGVKIHYTHPEKKATWAQHFSASDAASGEKEMAAQGYKVKKRELIYGKVGA